MLWWLRLRCGAVIAGLGIATIVEAVAFVSVLLPYHLRAIDEAEKRGYNRAKAEAADPYSAAVIELARERLK